MEELTFNPLNPYRSHKSAAVTMPFIAGLHEHLANQDPEAIDQSLSDALTADDDNDDAWSHAASPNPSSRQVFIPGTLLKRVARKPDDGVYRRWDPDDFICNPALDAASRNTALADVALVNPMWSLRCPRAFAATPRPHLQRGTSTRVAVLDTLFDPASHRVLSKLSKSSSDGMLFRRCVSVQQ